MNYKIQKFPNSRIASIDVCEVGKQKHHVTGLLEFDVTDSRKKIKGYNNTNNHKISFTAWLISVIGYTLKKYETSSAYLLGRNKLMIFEDINVSIIVEKDLKGTKVPIPLIIERANEVSMESITAQIAEAKNEEFTENDIILRKKTRQWEKVYYSLPGFLRRYFWKFILKHPKLAFKKMGNVAFTSIGMIGKVNGWFIPISVHPICFGVGSVLKKPTVIDDSIEIREILNMSVLMDHDVLDGAPMVRFICDLKENIEIGLNL
ncbi:2-oxo acid dehydrogenase subunit E2 [Cyclobacterium jeungdonense]|uniref:2-oxo acid dehydrogenase subunit E2 n=1 Tax=Cyclobacterium jeungdonense TaxID=708087 RepID=A0ABT8C2H9_9BACT|nr:2-oxo acid dehydrogenase subunit E2 [Cyclobacterium jeungdonense]MDN3686995.1 2-oxo acid dehydrogenase subunit E2 [Cyclobacterium jeungdonense]